MGATIFTANAAFDANLCATYCKSQTQYNAAHPAKDGSPPKVCNFFNTYILYKNSASSPQGQYCSMYVHHSIQLYCVILTEVCSYTEVWDQSYATNTGQYRGSDRYFVAYSYTYALTGNAAPAPSVGDKKGAVYQAAVDIKYSTLQPFCSTLLGYSAPIATAVVYSTITPVVTNTFTQINTVTVSTAKRDVSKSTPNVLTKYPATVLSSACSMLVTQGTSTSTVATLTSVSTAPAATTLVTYTSAVTSTLKAAPTGNAYCENGAPVDGTTGVCGSGSCVTFTMRIEGAEGTVYEGLIRTGPMSVTTPSGGTHVCDGTNNGANPAPYDNGISAISSGAGLCGYTFDGTFSNQFEDFFITRIGASDSKTSGNEFWDILSNYVFTPSGGCETEYSAGDELLWAFNAFNVNYFLKVSPPTAQVAVGSPVTFTVMGYDGNGDAGQAISGASFNG